jgi:hypothetical protein
MRAIKSCKLMLFEDFTSFHLTIAVRSCHQQPRGEALAMLGEVLVRFKVFLHFPATLASIIVGVVALRAGLPRRDLDPLLFFGAAMH